MALVCHCERVSDRTIRAKIRHGADDVKAVARRCGAGGGCGGCIPAIEALLATVRPPAVVEAAA
jgi:bacterioferritin-associated ferredoxin